MKQLNKSLCDFITAFELEHPTKGVCFEAKIYFFTQQLKMEAESEIHIITIDGQGMDVLYILSTTIGIEDMPSMFIIGNFEVSFNQQHGLKLKGTSSKWGRYVIVIQPTGKNCTEPTYQELNAKAYN